MAMARLEEQLDYHCSQMDSCSQVAARIGLQAMAMTMTASR